MSDHRRSLQPTCRRRRTGEDIAHGTVVLAAGRRLRPQDVGGLASLGMSEVAVFHFAVPLA
jgi:molybdopterin molybdotransferase